MQAGRKLTALAAISAALCMPLAACVDTASQVRVEPAAAPSKIARRPGVSPRGARMALASVSGAPQDVNGRFAQAFAQAAVQQDMTTVEPGKAEYLARIYIDAGVGDQGVTHFSYVVDLFDRTKKRVARLTDDVPVKGAADDSWSLADDTVLAALAARSAGDLADALTNTPEAVAGSAVASAAGASPAPRVAAAPSGSTTAARQAPDADATRIGLAASR